MCASARTRARSREAPTPEREDPELDPELERDRDLDLAEPDWGPVEDALPGSPGHALANGACAGYATAEGVYFLASRIDALVLCDDAVLRTAHPQRTSFGLAQVRRLLVGGRLRVLHVVFAPLAPRPVLFGIARLRNDGAAPLGVDYTETWDVTGSDYRAAVGACERRTADGVRALAEVSAVIRAAPLEPPPRAGLVLSVRLVLPPRSTRELCFAYAAPGPDEDAAALVRAWRGDVAPELARTAAGWAKALAGESSPVHAYRALAHDPSKALAR
jgi:hypothetical protein